MAARYSNIDPTILRHYHELIDKRKKQTSANSKDDKYKHMCVILDKGGEALITGYNIFKTNSPQTKHAEAMAMRKFQLKYGRPKRRIAVDILVVRTNGGNSKPCIKCLAQMELFSHIVNIKNIYYSHEDEPSGIRKEKFTSLSESDDKHVSSYWRHQLRMKKCYDDTDSSSSVSDDDSSDSSDSSISRKLKQHSHAHRRHR